MREDGRRYVAPAAFLLAVTIAVVAVRAGLRHGPAQASAPSTLRVSSNAPPTTTAAGSRKPRYWRVKAGDTFGVISARTGVPVRTLQRLNPRSSSTTLFIGEKIRLR